MSFVFLSTVRYRKAAARTNAWCIWERMEEWNFHHNMPITENRNREINWPACLVECILSAHKIKKKLQRKILARETRPNKARWRPWSPQLSCSKKALILQILIKNFEIFWEGNFLKQRSVEEIFASEVFRKSQTFLECYCSRVFVIDTVTISLLRLGFTFLSLWQKITWYIVLRLCLFYYHSNNSREGRRWDLKIWTFGLQPDEKSWHVLLPTCINKINK